jgi:hypothetical protein
MIERFETGQERQASQQQGKRRRFRDRRNVLSGRNDVHRIIAVRGDRGIGDGVVRIEGAPVKSTKPSEREPLSYTAAGM